MLLVKPDTLLRWHRAGFRLLWRRKTKAASNTPRVSRDVVPLITRLSKENRLWGPERIRGELLKLTIRVSKRTVQKYMRRARRPCPSVAEELARQASQCAHYPWAFRPYQHYALEFTAGADQPSPANVNLLTFAW